MSRARVAWKCPFKLPSSNEAVHTTRLVILSPKAIDAEAFDKLVPLVYAELRRVAHRYMRREHPGHSLQTTALVQRSLRSLD